MTPGVYADPQNPALPKADKLRVQAPYWYRFYVGEAEITVVSDGWHTMFNVQSNVQSFFYVGDVSHHSVLLLIENPRMEFLYDTDAKQAVETRLKMLSFLAENRIAILAYHFAWPGYGHFVKQGAGFRYLPGAMNMNL